MITIPWTDLVSSVLTNGQADIIPEDGTWMFRYDGSFGEFAPRLHLTAHKIVKETPMGKWIFNYGKNRFVLNEGKKRFAHETREAALNSFRIRKMYHIRILKEQLKGAEKDYILAGGVGSPEPLPKRYTWAYDEAYW